MVNLSNNEVKPILDSIGKEFTPHDMNALLVAMMPIPLICAEWITSFVNLARACAEASAMEGFMDYLRKSNIMLVVGLKFNPQTQTLSSISMIPHNRNKEIRTMV
jgi:hypothetical protein